MIIPYRCTHIAGNKTKKKWDNNRPSPCGRLSLFRFSSSSQKIRLFLYKWEKIGSRPEKGRPSCTCTHVLSPFFPRLFRDVVGAVREREFHHHRLLGWGGDQKELSARPITVFPTYDAHLNHLVSSYQPKRDLGPVFFWSQVKYYLAAAAAAAADFPVVAVCLCRILPAKFLDFILFFLSSSNVQRYIRPNR